MLPINFHSSMIFISHNYYQVAGKESEQIIFLQLGNIRNMATPPFWTALLRILVDVVQFLAFRI